MLNWDSLVLPDFTRFFNEDTSNEDEFLQKPWWWLRHHILALYSIPESITALRFIQDNPKDS